MSDLSLVLQTILRSKEPLTAEQVAHALKLKKRRITAHGCSTYLCRLALLGHVKRVGVKEQENRGRPKVLYAPEKSVKQIGTDQTIKAKIGAHKSTDL